MRQCASEPWGIRSWGRFTAKAQAHRNYGSEERVERGPAGGKRVSHVVVVRRGQRRFGIQPIKARRKRLAFGVEKNPRHYRCPRGFGNPRARIGETAAG